MITHTPIRGMSTYTCNFGAVHISRDTNKAPSGPPPPFFHLVEISGCNLDITEKLPSKTHS